LKNGDVIARDRSSIPPNIGTLLEAANRGRIYTQATWPQTHQRRRIGSRC
jgi:siroheme synthase (precorrin-2 oxidase/ferrochelatase)